MALLQQPAQRRGNQLIKLILKIYLNSNSNLPYKDFAFDMCRKGLAATRALSETQKLIQLSSRLQQKREKVSEIYRQWITAQSLDYHPQRQKPQLPAAAALKATCKPSVFYVSYMAMVQSPTPQV